MRIIELLRSRQAALLISVITMSSCAAFAGNIHITSPMDQSRSSAPVAITATAQENQPFHLEIWDNGNKLGNARAGFINTTTTLPVGSHTTTILAVSSRGVVLDKSNVSYTVTKKDAPGTVTIASPTVNGTSINAVRITASAEESQSSHLEIWDNGFKLGDVPANSVDDVYVLPDGSHRLTVQSVAEDGSVLSKSSVNYSVADDCTSSATAQCGLEQLEANNMQGYCNPPQMTMWVANPCGFGVQGQNGQVPTNTGIELVGEAGVLSSQGNLTLNGHSLHLWETQQDGWSNVLFRGQSPTKASLTSVDSHWILDEYVYLPKPADHQAFEMDAQYTVDGIWTKFYTECAFNKQAGKGYWAVFDTETGGWIFLNGKPQNGQTPPLVACDRSQFAQPWAGSANPSFSGWHHIAWSFLRNDDGTVTYQTLTFDGTTTEVNFRPNSQSGGYVRDNGNFSALIQLDGVANKDGSHGLVDAYVSKLNLIHTK